MIVSVLTSAVAYISTNIDDIFVIMILLAQAAAGKKGSVAVGHCLGVALVTLISMLGAFGLQNLPLKYVGILGLVPIFLGVRTWLANRKGEAEDSSDTAGQISVLGMAMITLGNGADNIGVYIPLFTAFSGPERIAAAVVFAGMTVLWLFLANTLSEFPKVKEIVGKYQGILVPLILIALGVYIILDSGLIG